MSSPEVKRQRSERPSGITDRSIDILHSIYRFRLLPTSSLLKLIEGNEDVTYRHLQRLHEAGLTSRFSLPKQRTPGEFIFYLDTAKSLELLAQEGRCTPQESDYKLVEQNRKRNYASASSTDGRLGQFLFVEHERCAGN